MPIRVNCMGKHTLLNFKFEISSEKILQNGLMMVNVSKITRTEYSMVSLMVSSNGIARAAILLPCALIFVRLMALPFLELKMGTSAIVVTMRQQKIPCLMTNAIHRAMGIDLKCVVVIGN